MDFFSDFFYLHPVIISYLGLINLIAFFIYGLDKVYARANAWRVRERTLLLLALCGGSLGAILGIQLFRHKTRKNIFLLYFSVILIAQLGLLLYFYSEVLAFNGQIASGL